MGRLSRVQVAVVGAGPAGLACALALNALGSEVTLVAPPHDAARGPADARTTALLASSVALLENLGVWRLCSHQAALLTAIRIIDDRGDLWRAPEVLFQASELGLASFGANIANPVLNAALTDVAAASAVNHLQTTVTRVTPGETSVSLDLADGDSLAASLVVAADGRGSLVRTSANIAVRTWQYPQAAIAAAFSHARPHAGTSTELHRRTGPLTTVPLPSDASSVVWVEEPARAREVAGLDDDGFIVALEERLRGLLGSIRAPSARAVYPLSGLSAARMGHNRVALIGEAGHVIPPIGAQGLNLGLRDACVLAECVAEARARGEDVGGPGLLAAYQKARQADVLSRTLAVDVLNRSLLADFLPAQALRGGGLHLLANMPFLRRMAMQGGMTPAGPLPRLMRPGALP